MAHARTTTAYRALLGFFLLFGITALWAVTTPKYAAPDEPAQAIKAAATARLELFGIRDFTPSVPNIRFTVPKTLAEGTNPGCFAFTPIRPASCLEPWHEFPGLEAADTYVGSYPPLYYFLVGWPSLLTHDVNVLLWMRLASAAISSVFLVAAFISASRVRRARGAVVGVAAATTPLALFLAGVVNPSGLEISSALCLWASGLALLVSEERERRRSLVFWTVLSAATLVQLRGLSPLFLAIITVTLLAVCGVRPFLALLRRRDMQIGAGVVGLSSIFAMTWIFGVGSLRLAAVGPPFSGSTLDALRESLSVGLAIPEIIGVFGWLDAYMPVWCYVAWGAVLAALAVAAVARRQWRAVAIVAALAFVTVAVPTLLAFSQARRIGIVGQGRDIAPVAVGVPLLAAYACFRWVSPTRRARLAVVALGAVLAAVQFTGFVQALHRYRTGTTKPIWVLNASWSPPIPWLLAIGLFAVLQALFLWWWSSFYKPDAATGAAEGERYFVAAPVTSPLPRKS